jgi:hypothetical protein
LFASSTAGRPAAPEAQTDEELDGRIERERREQRDQHERDRAPSQVDDTDSGSGEQNHAEHLDHAARRDAHLPLRGWPVPIGLERRDTPAQIAHEVAVRGPCPAGSADTNAIAGESCGARVSSAVAVWPPPSSATPITPPRLPGTLPASAVMAPTADGTSHRAQHREDHANRQQDGADPIGRRAWERRRR